MHKTWLQGCWTPPGFHSWASALVRKKGRRGCALRDAPGAPPPPPGAAAWHPAHPSSTPANRRRTPIEQLLRGAAGQARHPAPPRHDRGPSSAGLPGRRGRREWGSPSHAPPPPAWPAAGAARTPALRGRQRRTPKDGHPAGARPEREPERERRRRPAPSFRPSGRRLPSARPPAAGPSSDPGRASAPPQPLILASFIGHPSPAGGAGPGARRKGRPRRGRGGK